MAMIAPPLLRPAATSGSKSPSTTNLAVKAQRPTFPLQRKSTLKRSIDETTPVNVPSSPSKRNRVAWDSDVEIVSADDDDDLDPLVVKEQVRRAIERHRNGNHESYEAIRGIFTAAPDGQQAPTTRVVKVHLSALLANVAGLSKDCSSLVHAIIFSEWIGRDDTFYHLFVRFITNLAAAHRGFQNKIMAMLVELLGPQKTRRLPGCRPVTARSIYQRALTAIKFITDNVPSAPASFADRISAQLEFEFSSLEERMPYITNFMELIKYTPDLANEIITSILRQLIKLDVGIQENLDDVEDEVEEELLQHMSESQTLLAGSAVPGLTSGMPSPPSDTDDLDSVTSELEEEEKQALLVDESPEDTSRRLLKDNIKQVDLIMDVLFTYFTSLTSSADTTIRSNAIEQLISLFRVFILPTHRSRHPQFLIFHFAQLDGEAIERFLAACCDVLMDKRNPPHIRHAAATYYSGFVGRGAHVSSLVVSDSLDLLVDELNALRQRYQPSCRGPDLKRYGDFYAAFQAILYIFCFRWRDISIPESEDEESDDDDDDLTSPYHKQLPSSNKIRFEPSLHDAIHGAIYSPLNPLRVCTFVIVEQFAKLGLALKWMYVFPKIEENKHVRITSSDFRSMGGLTIGDAGRDMSWAGDNGMLEGYFPYDPYSLPISKKWIEGDYVEWKGIPGEETRDEANNPDDDEDEETDEDGYENI